MIERAESKAMKGESEKSCSSYYDTIRETQCSSGPAVDAEHTLLHVSTQL